MTYDCAAPGELANGVTTFGMWTPGADPGGSGLIANTRWRGQEGAASDASMHTHLGVQDLVTMETFSIRGGLIHHVEAGLGQVTSRGPG